MKIRNGFVSNSSSSSFVLIGEIVDIQKLTVEDLKKNKYITDVGECYDGGKVYADLNGSKILEFLQLRDLNEEYDLGNTYLVYYYSYHDGISVIDFSKFPDKKLVIVSETVDQYSPDNDDFDYLIKMEN